MNNEIDARGKACPIPVMMAKKEADRNILKFTISVDNITAVKNLKRFGKNSGYKTTVTGDKSDYTVYFTKNDDQFVISDDILPSAETKGWAVFAGREGIGGGEPELGASLIKMFFYTLAEDDNIPRYILFMNKGVYLPAYNKQIIEQLNILKEKGSEILICGTCLNFYGIKETPDIGTVSNMYDITEALKSVSKVITL